MLKRSLVALTGVPVIIASLLITPASQADGPAVKPVVMVPAVAVTDNACPATLSWSVTLKINDVGGWNGTDRTFPDQGPFDFATIPAPDTVRCNYNGAMQTRGGLTRKFPGKTCTVSADKKTFTCK